MMNYVLTTLITSFSAGEIVLLIYNHKTDYKYKFWIVLSFISEVILCVGWILTAIFLQGPGARFEPQCADFIIAITYFIIAIFHLVFLFLADDEKIEKNRNFYFDEKTGMLRKYNEEKFNDGRTLYCASSLIRKEDNDRNK